MGLMKAWSLKKVRKELRPWRLISAFRWKRQDFQPSILDDVVFRIMYVVEAVVLVSILCFFFVCCGCHF
ncbi:hypothetical protein L484_021370 [Morus notabilis]|uniref:Transmembrane protein n=1 Tax=Morus notabilis TaxID=981085 RepID=W9RQG5_9ROSA|nr:uncharacterized protein LOC21404229 [Morus notabilis]EXB92386.1 hypothetical protein L484_021370 [Morus notabilis]